MDDPIITARSIEQATQVRPKDRTGLPSRTAVPTFRPDLGRKNRMQQMTDPRPGDRIGVALTRAEWKSVAPSIRLWLSVNGPTTTGYSAYTALLEWIAKMPGEEPPTP